MPKQKPYLDEQVDDAIAMLCRQSKDFTHESAECGYRKVVLALLLNFEHILLGFRKFLFFFCGLLGGALLGKLLSLMLSLGPK